MVQRWQNHWKTINADGALEKNINHSIAPKKWPSNRSIGDGDNAVVSGVGDTGNDICDMIFDICAGGDSGDGAGGGVGDNWKQEA